MISDRRTLDDGVPYLIGNLDLALLFNQVIAKASNVYNEARGGADLFGIVGMGADLAPTTLLDRTLEEAAIEAIVAHVGFGTILSEERGMISFGNHDHADPMFVLDPLDGTSNAAMGFPYFALSLATVVRGEIVAGIIYNYCTGDLFSAFKGRGARLNGRLVTATRADVPLEAMRIVLSKPFSSKEAAMYVACILGTKRVRLTGCPSLDVASVASGSFDAYVDVHENGLIHTHDIIAGKLILEEAGGSLLNWTGASFDLELSPTRGYNVFAVANRSVYDQLAKIFPAMR